MQTYGTQNGAWTTDPTTMTRQYGTLQESNLSENSFQDILLKHKLIPSLEDKIGQRRVIRRRGLFQNDKVRGIGNARTSGTRLQDTILTTPRDIAMKILCWLLNGKQGEERFVKNGFLWVGLSGDDLADAYHEVPNIPPQLNLCVVAIRNPHSGLTEFYICRTHLLGLLQQL